MMRTTLVAVGALLALSCAGKQSVASKSAAAYREAVAKGTPVGAGGHGGHAGNDHSATTSTSPDQSHHDMAGMDHSQMSPAGSMAGMQHGSPKAMAKMDHSQMQHTSTGAMAGMQHGKTTGMANMDHAKMQHGSTGMAGMQHDSSSAMPGMDHSKMQQGSTAMPDMQRGSMPGMQHGAVQAVVVPPAPATSSGIARLSPSSTLNADDFDAPAPAAVSEAKKAAGEGAPQHSHQNEGAQ